MTCFIGEMWYIVEREMWYIDSGLITTQHTTYYCYVTYDLCALYNVDLDLQNMLNHPDGVKAPKEILLHSKWLGTKKESTIPRLASAECKC